ncbi:MAG: glycosyltransferase family 39 protein [Bacteroidota bacterium]
MNRQRDPWILLVLSALFYIPFLGGVHLFDWDEINFAEMAREMLVRDNYLQISVDFEAFFQKPPLFIWMQLLSMKLFGVGEFAARLPNAICGIITLQILYQMGRRLYDARFGWLWAIAYFGSILPHLYFRSGIIDPWFNLFIFLGLYYLILFVWKRDSFKGIELSRGAISYLLLAGMMVGFGILTKGPVAFLIVGLVLFVYWIWERFRMYITIPQFLLFTLASSLVTLIWFGVETLQNGTDFVIEFTKYQYKLFSTPDAGHQGFPGYHFVVLLLGCFPASVFALRAFAKLPEAAHPFQANFTRWMKILFWVVLILFTIVQSKIVHYSSLCYFPISFLAALVLHHWLKEDLRFTGWMAALMIAVTGIFIAASLALPVLGNNIEWLQERTGDAFARANMNAETVWTHWHFIPGVALLLTLLLFFYFRKMGRRPQAINTIFIGTACYLWLGLAFFINNIEHYTQRAAVDF